MFCFNILYTLKLEALYSYVWWLCCVSCEFSREAKKVLPFTPFSLRKTKGKENLGFSSIKFHQGLCFGAFFGFSLLLENCFFFFFLSKGGYAAISDCEAPSVCSDSTVLLCFPKKIHFSSSWVGYLKL